VVGSSAHIRDPTSAAQDSFPCRKGHLGKGELASRIAGMDFAGGRIAAVGTAAEHIVWSDIAAPDQSIHNQSGERRIRNRLSVQQEFRSCRGPPGMCHMTRTAGRTRIRNLTSAKAGLL
jgi:hypothetical protein